MIAKYRMFTSEKTQKKNIVTKDNTFQNKNNKILMRIPLRTALVSSRASTDASCQQSYSHAHIHMCGAKPNPKEHLGW